MKRIHAILASFVVLLLLPDPVELMAKESETEETVLALAWDFESITMEEFEMIAKCIYAEARGEGFEAMEACAEVILNRVEYSYYDRYPDTVEGVITQKNQFTAYKNGNMNKAVPDDATYEAVQAALEERILPKGIFFFSSDGWFSWTEPYMQIGRMYYASDIPKG